MKAIQQALLSAVLLAFGPTGHADTLAPSRAQQIEALFSRWQGPDAPGAAVEVLLQGKPVYRGAFGMADIEQGRPITPSTPFHVASVSKQFTAFAVLLLAQEGRLSLNDDVRHHVPELPDFGQVIRIHHLLHHTSGLRDQLNLLALAGWRMEDVITDDDVMRLVCRQRSLNFLPGSEYEYSNTGYTLLARIVERVSGQTLAAFAKARIFEPLGMKNTRFHEQHGALVPGRAQSYQPSPGTGYERVALSFSTVGPSSLLTTADDLALWNRNFDEAGVGGQPLLAEMQTPGQLKDGKVIDYANGLVVDQYRGLRRIAHSGSDAGYRSLVLRFPEQQLSIILIANGADLPVARLADRIADLYLDPQLAAPPAPVPELSQGREVVVDAARLDALVGSYALDNGSAITFTKEQGRLVGWTIADDKMPYDPSGEREFFAKLVNARFSFDPPGADGVVRGGSLQRNARIRKATRMAAGQRSASALKAIEGEYYSEELHVLYTAEAVGQHVILHTPRGEVELVPFGQSAFMGPWPYGLVQFQCPATGACTGFTATEDRARDLQFNKVRLVTAGGVEH